MTTTEECYVCGRPVRVDRPHWMMHVVDVPADADLGWFPVGPECRRQVDEWETLSDRPALPGARGILACVAVERWEGR